MSGAPDSRRTGRPRVPSIFTHIPSLEEYRATEPGQADGVGGGRAADEGRSAGDAAATGPWITVITVVLNGEAILERTIQSVISQSYPNVEYIVIDGGSTDASLDVIRRHAGRIDHWISAKDRGIADAMNKGIAMARGAILNFLNAGDYYVNSDALDYVACWYRADSWWWAYGLARLQINYRETSLTQRSRPFRKWKNYYLTQNCHQATFFRRALFERVGLYALGNDRFFDVEFYMRATDVALPATSDRMLVWYDVTGLSAHVHWASLRARIRLTFSWRGPLEGLVWIVPIVTRWGGSAIGLHVKRLLGWLRRDEG